MERLFNSISFDMYRFLISNNPDAIFLLDESGHVLDINKAGTNIFGYTNAERSELTLKQPQVSVLPSFHKTERI